MKTTTIFLLCCLLLALGGQTAAAASADPDSPDSYLILGYAGAQSVAQGGSIDLHVSTLAPNYSLVIYRWGANGLEEKHRVEALTGAWYGDCAPNSHLGCGWPIAYTLSIPADWRSGLYALRLLTPDEDITRLVASWVFFVVRAARPGATSPVLYMLNEATWQAYNYYNGLSYYPDETLGRGRANILSFDRPYDGNCSLLWTCVPWRNWPLIQWLEKNGYTVEYASNYDVHAIPDLLSHYRLFIDDAHDEYWSWPMRDQTEEFIADGGNAMFFSSNTSYWQVRYEDNGRTMVGYKSEVAKDPVLTDGDPSNDRLATSNWCTSPVNRCETQMLGVTYFNGGRPAENGMTAYYPNHWIWAGTNIKNGQYFGATETYGSLTGIVASEIDGAKYNLSTSAPKITQDAITQGTPGTFEILGTMIGTAGVGTMGVYTNTAGATVWSSATWDWAVVGLSAPNPIVDKVTRNLLNRLAFSAPWPETSTLSLPMGMGWNLVSMPYTPDDDATSAVFSSIAGQYDLIEAYDGCQPDDPWRIYDPAAPEFVNTLTQINTGIGLWVRTTSEPTLALTGRPLTSDVTLSLCAGWNLIGYPASTARDALTVLEPISGKYDLVEAYDGTNPDNPWLIHDPAAPPFVNTLVQFEPGKGYWIRMTQAANLTISR